MNLKQTLLGVLGPKPTSEQWGSDLPGIYEPLNGAQAPSPARFLTRLPCSLMCGEESPVRVGSGSERAGDRDA